MSSGNDRKRKHSKAYYIKSAKKSRDGKSRNWQVLGPDMKGFLLTCNFREKDSVREAYNLLNEYADKMYGPEEGFLQDKKEGQGESEEEEEDIEAALKKEVKEMRDVKPKDRRFQVVDTGAKNCIFVKTTVEDPVKLVYSIMSDVYDSKQCKVRHIQRLLPIAQTCKSYADNLKTLIPNILQPVLDTIDGGRPSYCVNFKVRNNNSIGRSEVYEIVAETLMDCRVDTVNPEIVVIIEVIKSVCCVSVLKDFFKFRKYNMHEIVGHRTNESAVTEGGTSQETSKGGSDSTDKPKEGASSQDNLTEGASSKDEPTEGAISQETSTGGSNSQEEPTGESNSPGKSNGGSDGREANETSADTNVIDKTEDSGN